MLFILILLIWLAVMVLVVAACRVAARADQAALAQVACHLRARGEAHTSASAPRRETVGQADGASGETMLAGALIHSAAVAR